MRITPYWALRSELCVSLDERWEALQRQHVGDLEKVSDRVAGPDVGLQLGDDLRRARSVFISGLAVAEGLRRNPSFSREGSS